MANVVRDPREHPDAIIPDLKTNNVAPFTLDQVAFVYGSKWKQRYFTRSATITIRSRFSGTSATRPGVPTMSQTPAPIGGPPTTPPAISSAPPGQPAMAVTPSITTSARKSPRSGTSAARPVTVLAAHTSRGHRAQHIQSVGGRCDRLN